MLNIITPPSSIFIVYLYYIYSIFIVYICIHAYILYKEYNNIHYADLPTGECIITRCSVPAVGVDGRVGFPLFASIVRQKLGGEYFVEVHEGVCGGGRGVYAFP